LLHRGILFGGLLLGGLLLGGLLLGGLLLARESILNPLAHFLDYAPSFTDQSVQSDLDLGHSLLKILVPFGSLIPSCCPGSDGKSNHKL
jgi:hypothetical protein